MRSKHPSRLRRLARLSAGLIAAVATAAVAEDKPAAVAADKPAAAADEARQLTPPAVAAGLTVFVDPDTGAISEQPSAEQRAALAQALKSSLNKSSAGLETFELRGGGHGAHLQGRFRSAAIARLRPDGSFEIRCVDHPDEAAVLLTAPAPADRPPVVEK